MGNDSYTEEITDIINCARERRMLTDILNAWREHGLPPNFDDSGIKPAMNTHSGYVFLVNDDFQCCMERDGRLVTHHSTPYHGHEGFLDDLLDEHEPGRLNREDIDYILENAEIEGVELPAKWARYRDDGEEEEEEEEEEEDNDDAPCWNAKITEMKGDLK